MAKFKPGQFVMASNGRGDVYMINRIIPAGMLHGGTFQIPGEDMYDLDNGSVDVRKRQRSGWHRVAKIDRYWKAVE
jgi:hypothetical protein